MKLLFLCVANSARSQLAEGLARAAFPEARVESAGSRPGRLNPHAVQALKEIGIDISRHRSKSVDELDADFLRDLDWVVTLCEEEVCPMIVSKAKRLHWPLPDPATKEPLPEAESLARFRNARDAIAARLRAWKETLR